MTAFDWKSLVRTIAPTLGTALGGPLGGMATSAIANAILPPDTPAEKHDVMLQAALVGATPDMLLKIKQADQDFAAKMKELDIDLEKLTQEDRANARAREISVKDRTPALLAWLSILGFFGILVLLMVTSIKAEVKDPLMIMLGVLGAIVTSVYAYYFGSSSGSAAKNETIQGMLGKDK